MRRLPRPRTVGAVDQLAVRVPYVIDNQTHRMGDVLATILREHAARSLDIATAYFTVPGLSKVLSAGISKRCRSTRKRFGWFEDLIGYLRRDSVLVRLHDKGFLHAK